MSFCVTFSGFRLPPSHINSHDLSILSANTRHVSRSISNATGITMCNQLCYTSQHDHRTTCISRISILQNSGNKSRLAKTSKWNFELLSPSLKNQSIYRADTAIKVKNIPRTSLKLSAKPLMLHKGPPHIILNSKWKIKYDTNTFGYSIKWNM